MFQKAFVKALQKVFCTFCLVNDTRGKTNRDTQVSHTREIANLRDIAGYVKVRNVDTSWLLYGELVQLQEVKKIILFHQTATENTLQKTGLILR